MNSTSLAASTSCSHCCASALSTGLELWLYPVLLGSGKQVFGDGTVPTALRLIESVTYSNGMLHLTYETAGTPTYGQKGSPELTSE
jgi:hypothetical protein